MKRSMFAIVFASLAPTLAPLTPARAESPACQGRVSCLYGLGQPARAPAAAPAAAPAPAPDPATGDALLTMRKIHGWMADIDGRSAEVEASTQRLEALLARAPRNVGVDLALDAQISSAVDSVMAAKRPLFDDGMSILQAAMHLLTLNRTLGLPTIEPFVKRANAAAGRATDLASRAQNACVQAALRPLDPDMMRRATDG